MNGSINRVVTQLVQSFVYAHKMRRRQLFDHIINTAQTPEESRIYHKVLDYLMAAHFGQKRKGPTPQPYFIHIYMVWVQAFMANESFPVQLAHLLHDTVEDAPKRLNKSRAEVRRDIGDLTERFADEVLAMVDGLTNKKGLKAEDKHRWQLEHFKTLPAATQRAKLRDKIANTWDSAYNMPDWHWEKLLSQIILMREMYDAAAEPDRNMLAMVNYVHLRLTEAIADRDGILPR